MTAPSALLTTGIRPLTSPPSPCSSAPLAWSVRPERIEVTTADERIETRERWAVCIEGQLLGWRETEADATEQARDLAGVS